MFSFLIVCLCVLVVVLIVLVVSAVRAVPVHDDLGVLARVLLDDEDVIVTGNWISNHHRILSFNYTEGDVYFETCVMESECSSVGSAGTAEVIFAVNGDSAETTVDYRVVGSVVALTDGINTFRIDHANFNPATFSKAIAFFTSAAFYNREIAA